MRLQRERFGLWFFKALNSLVGNQGMLFLVNIIAVFFSWSFFIMVFFVANSGVPIITSLGFMYIYKLQVTVGSFLLFIATVMASSWTYWDAYVRLAKPDRRPPRPPPMTSMQKAPQKIIVPKELKKKKPIMVSMQPLPQKTSEPPHVEEIIETKQTIETTVKKSGHGRPKGSKNKMKTQES